MADLYGYNFSPDLANKFRSSLNNPTGASQLGPQVGQALRVISLHLPGFTGGSPIAPDGLLRPSRSFTPDAAVRAQTTGVPPSSGPQSAPAQTPAQTPAQSSLQLMPRIPFGGSAPDNGPESTFGPMPLPRINFGEPPNGNGAPVPAAPAPPSASPVGGPAGGGMDRQNPLSGLLDAILRTRGGV